MITLPLLTCIVSLGLGAKAPQTTIPWVAWLILISWLIWVITRRSFLTLPLIALSAFFTGAHASYITQPLPDISTATYKILTTREPELRSDRIYLVGEPIEGELSGKPLRIEVNRYPLYSNGDLLLVRGAIKPAGDFLRFRHILGEIKSKDPPKVLVASQRKPNLFTVFRRKLENQINTELPEPESSFLSGLLLGSKRAIPKRIQEELQATGTSHLVAISGANVTFLLSFVGVLIKVRSNSQRALLTCGVAVGLCLLTGSSASVVRGAVMAAIPTAIQAFKRPVHAPTVILITATVMLSLNPLLIWYDSGFQLSFGAFLGVAYLKPLLQKASKKVLKNFSENVAVSAFTETAAASFGTAPVMLLNGNPPITVLGFIANPLVLWLIPAASVLGLALLVTSPIPGISNLVSQIAWVPLNTILLLIHSTSSYTWLNVFS